MRYRNPKFKRSIRDEIKPQVSHEGEPQVKSETTEPQVKHENFIATPSKESIRRLWWSKYSPDLKNPQVKDEVPPKKKNPSESQS